MLMVVFGAGASFDSVSAQPLPAGKDLQDFVVDGEVASRLPLANHLFNPIPLFSRALDEFPQAAPLFPALSHGARSVGVEARLEEYQKEAAHRPDRTRQLASLRFYLRSIIERAQGRWLKNQRPRLNHIALLDEIEGGRKNEDVLLVTFNYDTLLEVALGILGLPIETIDDYVSRHSYKLIKLHGSIDWGRVVDFPIRRSWDPAEEHFNAAEIIGAATDWQLSDEYVRMTHYINSDNVGSVYVPAIAVPVIQKSHFECPRSHLNLLKGMLPDVDRILTIGWAGNEKHFLKLLTNGLTDAPAIGTVCGSEGEAEKTMENLLSAHFSYGRTHAFAHGFSQFVEERAGKAFFNWP